MIESKIEKWKEAIQDPTFASVEEWKQDHGGKAVAYFPVYTPVELIDAADMLPVGIMGAGNKLEITNADARFGSFICSIVKSTMELGMRDHLDLFSAVLFHSICDTARNLAFLFKRNFSDRMFVEYIHFPQNPQAKTAADYLSAELRRVAGNLQSISGKEITDEGLNRSIDSYNENRRHIRELYAIRKNTPHLISTMELYVLIRAGNYMNVKEHSNLLKQALREIPERNLRKKDRIRVVLEGSFCEQPPLELLEALEEAGCYIVDDDLILGRRWFTEDVRVNGDPYHALAEAYLCKSSYSSVQHNWKQPRMEQLLGRVRRAEAEAVVFCIAKFCEPAFFDYVLFKDVLDRENIPHLLVEFEEKMWTFEKARNEIETFVESILFD